jgi:hypothetical protein
VGTIPELAERERNSSDGSTRESEVELEVTVRMGERVLNSEFSIGDSHGKFLLKEDLNFDLKTSCVL